MGNFIILYFGISKIHKNLNKVKKAVKKKPINKVVALLCKIASTAIQIEELL